MSVQALQMLSCRMGTSGSPGSAFQLVFLRPSVVRLLNILVPVNCAVDYAVKIRVNPQQTALAMGADSAIHVEIPESAPAPEPLGVAQALRAIIQREKESAGVDLVIMGKQVIDDNAGQTGQMLAGLLGWRQATFASKVEVDAAAKTAVVMREIDSFKILTAKQASCSPATCARAAPRRQLSLYSL